MKYFIPCIFLIFSTVLEAVLDLDNFEQSFVLEAKQIHVKGYPDAFNPSIVYWNKRLLMSFRSRDPVTHLANVVGFTWLDDNFDPVGKPMLLKMPENKLSNNYIQDPRLFVVNGRLFMAYSDLYDDSKTLTKQRKMSMAELIREGNHFVATQCDCFNSFEGDPTNKFEKNWVPFDYQGIMLLAYSLNPHKIFLPVMGESRCVTIAQSYVYNEWDWGVLRGGTPALLMGKYYLSFFHSSLTLKTVQSNNKPVMHYVMGAYLFDSQPPFTIKKISPHPIVSKNFYNGKTHPTWKPLQVVFPCGYIHNKKYLWVSYGRQDHEAWIIKLDKAGLIKSLIPFEGSLY